MKNLALLKKSSAIVHKTAPIGNLEAKAATDKYPFGYVEGYLSTFNNVDSAGDVIRKGAWAKTIKEKIAAGAIPLMKRHYIHGGDSSDVLGSIIAAKEDDYGLWVRGVFSPDPASQEIREKVVNGHIRYFSAGFRIINYRQHVEHESGAMVDELTELALMEGTITPFPANNMAVITAAKDLRETAMEIDDPKLDLIMRKLDGLLEIIGKSGLIEDEETVPEVESVVVDEKETENPPSEEDKLDDDVQKGEKVIAPEKEKPEDKTKKQIEKEETDEKDSKEGSAEKDPPSTEDTDEGTTGTPESPSLDAVAWMEMEAELAAAESALCEVLQSR